MGLLSLVPESIQSAIQAQLRSDSWVSTILGLGGVTDKRFGTAFVKRPVLTPDAAMRLFTDHDLARLVCTIRPTTALRRGFQVCIDDDDERESDLAMRLDELQALQAITSAAIWGLTTGGGVILMGVDDGQLPEEPIKLDPDGNPQGIRAIQYLKVFDRRRVQINAYELDPTKRTFGQPATYRLLRLDGNHYQSVIVHASRLIVMPGILTGDQERQENVGWDHSILQPCYDVLQEFGIGWSAATLLLTDASQAVYAIKGLNQILASESGESSLQARMRVTEMSRSVARALVIDADGEKFEKIATSFAGVPDLLDRLSNRLAAAARIPVSILMGQAPAGLNATGQADLETFYGEITAWQRDVATPAIRQLARMVMAEDSSNEPDVWRVEFLPVNPQYDKQQAELRKLVGDTDKQYIDSGVATPEEIALSRFGADGYSTETTIDLDLRREVKDTGAPVDPAADPETASVATPTSADPTTTESGQPIPVEPVANTAMNGAQITGMRETVKDVVTGAIPRDAGLEMLKLGFNITTEQAEKVMGSAGKGFVPAPSAPPPTFPEVTQ